MKSWLEVDADGREYLVRSGTGIVTAVSPLTHSPVTDASDFLRVDISCDAPAGRARAIRYSAHPRVLRNSVIAELAQRAEEGQFSVNWTVEWHRLDHIPGNIPIMSLNLSTDTHASLIVLERVLSERDVQVEIPDFVPASWES